MTEQPKVKTNGKGPLVQILDDIVNSDLTATRNEYHFRTPFLVDKLTPQLKDQRDLPMLCLLLNITEFIVVGVSVVYGLNIWAPELSASTRHAVGFGYLISLILLFQERFILCLHFASHRTIFHNDLMNHALGYVFAPFFGIPTGVYKLHHVIMHHIENNHEGDASSTEEFQRDSFFDFGKYWFRFFIRIWYDLTYYTISTKRWNWFSTLFCGLTTWLLLIYKLATRVSFVATLWVFMIPHVFAMSVMAFGNWSQHMFVNPDDRHSNYALTYNCLDTPINQTTFNDGYHVIHHLNARLHWSEIPQYFYDTREKHIQGGALTFRGVHFMEVGALVMSGQIRKLAEKYYVHLGSRETAPTVDEVEAKLHAWLKPCPRAEKKSKSS